MAPKKISSTTPTQPSGSGAASSPDPTKGFERPPTISSDTEDTNTIIVVDVESKDAQDEEPVNKDAMIGVALSGALISTASNNQRDKIVKDTITGGAVAIAVEFMNYLT
ncbi:hypothetical protein GUJ93_ZPchr0001g30306 [Zizania palustris]|uniref:Uncharacterized protein n=1 Tax=Zizania palustris TaxID=103762 RepID=A0A8J5UZP7_ZIZPA|nr:hypothetical protein GUJ93_ZPchr0001g30306 [Zizania palustris]